MKRLSSYRKSKVLNIKINYNGEEVLFNLSSELRINPDIINDNLKSQPGYYGFCLLLHKKLLTVFEKYKMERKSVYGRLFLKAKGLTQSGTGRTYSDDAAKCWVESHKDFIKVTKQCIKAKEDADVIYAAVKAFEQRKDMLQSISSNVRNEK